MIWTHLPKVIPSLSDELVTVRPYQVTDIEFIRDVGREEKGFTNMENDTRQEAAKELAGHMARPHLQHGHSWVVVRNDTGESVGHIGLWLANIALGKVTIGYITLKRHQGNGFAKHALKLVSEWGGALPYVSRLELHIEPWNTSSIKVAEFAGYENEGLNRRFQVIDGYPRDMFLYTLLPPLGEEFVDERSLDSVESSTTQGSS